MRVAIYARLSQAAEDHDDDRATPTDRQVAECLACAKLRGWTIAGVYRDEGKSGYKGTWRPEFERMLDDAAAGLVDAVLAWKLDRLSRNRPDWNRVMDLCDAGLVLASVTEALDSSTPTGRVMRDVLALFARMESENISVRTAAAFQAMARQGKPRIAGRRPFGRMQDRVTPHPAEAEQIRALAGRLLAGDSLRGLALELNRRGVTTSYGKQWTPSAVRRVLVQPGNVGDLVHRGQVAARGVLPPILDPDTYRQVVELVSHPGRRTHQGRPRTYILTGGLARCGHPDGTQTIGHLDPVCGNVLSSRPEANGYRRYICLRDGKVHLSVTADGLERHVDELALVALTGPRLHRALAQGRDSATQQLADQVAADEAALAQLHDDYYDHHILERGEFLARQLRLRDRIDRQRAQLARRAERRILAELPAGDQLRAAWAQWDLDKRRAVLDAVFVAVVVRPTRRGARQLDPDRVEPIWRI